MSIANATSTDMLTLYSTSTVAEGKKEVVTKRLDSLQVFENVRASVQKATGEKTLLSNDDNSVFKTQMNLWIFDRLINGPWEYEAGEVSGLTSQTGEKIQFNSWSKHVIPGYVNLKGQTVEQMDVTTWSPIIAIYRRAREILLVNEAYYQGMGTNERELQKLLEAGKTGDLFQADNAKHMQELVWKLAQGGAYKNEPLKAKRTRRTVSWNSFGTETSGSMRIGKDVTHGEHSEIPARSHPGMTLGAKKTFAKIIEQVESMIHTLPEVDARVMRTRLRAMAACTESVDTFWENGPFLMNIIASGKIYGNKNYSDLIDKPAAGLPLSELYSPEQLAVIEKKFAEGRESGHYAQEFTMTPSDGKPRTIAWHRYFPNNTGVLGNKMSFGIGTTSITDTQAFENIKANNQ